MLASGAGFSVASIYYSQPMLEILSSELHASVTTSGLVPTLTQMGYALGILLLAPLGIATTGAPLLRLKACC